MATLPPPAPADGRTDGRTDGIPALAHLLEFGDSMLPVGAFACSGVLESAVQAGIVHDVDTLRAFTTAALEQSARSDAVALACALRAAVAGDWAELVRIDRTVYCRKLPEETRRMSTRMGRKLTELCAAVTGLDAMERWLALVTAEETPGVYAVSLGLLFGALGLSLEQALSAHQYGVAATILNAALRLMRITHLDTQRILFHCIENFDAWGTQAARTSLDDMNGFAPMTEILGAAHVGAHVRLFMN